MNEAGYAEGQNVLIDYHWLVDRLPAFMGGGSGGGQLCVTMNEPTSTITIRGLMDEGAIVIRNLSKGRLGEGT